MISREEVKHLESTLSQLYAPGRLWASVVQVKRAEMKKGMDALTVCKYHGRILYIPLNFNDPFLSVHHRNVLKLPPNVFSRANR